MRYSFDNKASIIEALTLRGTRQRRLFAAARAARRAVFGDRAEARSVIEYSNICRQECRFCGMNRRSCVGRYVLDDAGVLASVERLYEKGRRVVMFQSGENAAASFHERLVRMIGTVKKSHPDLTIIGSFGSLPAEKYRALKDAGVDRYILKFETSDPRLYRSIKPSDTLGDRLRHIRLAQEAGLRVSTGNIIGLPGQTLESLAGDLMLIEKINASMGSASVFIPNDRSSFARCAPGDLETVLNFTAVLRLRCPGMLIPATSSLETLARGGQLRGLEAGANVVTFHDGTPPAREREFVIYTQKRATPDKSLTRALRRAHLFPARASLLRVPLAETAYHRLVVKNIGRPAVASGSRVRTYARIHALCARFRGFLDRTGVAEGDVVLLAAHDSLEFVVAFLSCVMAGVTVAPVDPRAGARELRRIISDVRPQKIFCTGSLRRALNDARAVKIADDDDEGYFLSLMARQAPARAAEYGPDLNNPAVILFTSGTTGRPKGVVHRHQDLLVDTFPRTVLKLTPADTLFCCSRMHTGFGLGNSLLFPFQAGARVILSSTVPHYGAVRDALRRGPTVFCAVPSMYSLLLDQGRELKNLLQRVRIFVVSGEKMSPALYRNWKAGFGSRLLECFGNTELWHSFISNVPGRENPESCGRVLEGFSVTAGAGGKLSFSGPTLFTGYYRDPALTRAKLAGGRFRSDDRGFVDGRGFVFITGRDNDVFKHHGAWVSLPDIEAALNALPGVAESAAVRAGGGLRYYVKPRRGADAAALERRIRRSFVRSGQPHLLPGSIRMVDDIPKTKNGKIDRRGLA